MEDDGVELMEIVNIVFMSCCIGGCCVYVGAKVCSKSKPDMELEVAKARHRDAEKESFLDVDSVHVDVEGEPFEAVTPSRASTPPRGNTPRGSTPPRERAVAKPPMPAADEDMQMEEEEELVATTSNLREPPSLPRAKTPPRLPAKKARSGTPPRARARVKQTEKAVLQM